MNEYFRKLIGGNTVMGESARRPLFESYTDDEIQFLDRLMEGFAMRTRNSAFLPAKIYQDAGGRWHFHIKDKDGNLLARDVTEYGYPNKTEVEVVLDRMAMSKFFAEYEEYRENPIKKMERERNEREDDS